MEHGDRAGMSWVHHQKLGFQQHHYQPISPKNPRIFDFFWILPVKSSNQMGDVPRFQRLQPPVALPSPALCWIHSMVVVTSPMGLQAPPALAATTTRPPHAWRHCWPARCPRYGSCANPSGGLGHQLSTIGDLHGLTPLK
jgi:hypothetical protein